MQTYNGARFSWANGFAIPQREIDCTPELMGCQTKHVRLHPPAPSPLGGNADGRD